MDSGPQAVEPSAKLGTYAVYDLGGGRGVRYTYEEHPPTLDDYADVEEFFAAKLPLFKPDRARRAVICLDSASGVDVVAEAEKIEKKLGNEQFLAKANPEVVAEQRQKLEDFNLAVTKLTQALGRLAGL